MCVNAPDQRFKSYSIVKELIRSIGNFSMDVSLEKEKWSSRTQDCNMGGGVG